LIDHTGTTTLDNGTLQFLDLDDLHSSKLTIDAGATAEFRNAVRNFNRFSATSIEGTGTFVKTGTSILTTGNATNQFARWNMTGGLIDIREGEFRADYQDQALAWVNNKASMNVEAGAFVSMVGGNHISVDALTGAGTVQNINSWGVGIFTVGQNNGSGTFSGTLRNNGGVLALTKTGSGTQTLSGTLIDHTGTTTVNNGTLQFLDLDDLHSSTLTIGAGSTVEFKNNVRNFNRFSATSIEGTGTFVKTGTSLLQTGNATNQFARWNMTGGLIDIREGEFRADYQDQALAWVNNKASMNVDAGAFVSMVGGNHISVDALTGAGTVQNINSWGVGIFTVGQNNGSGTFSGTLRNNGGVLALTKTGSGTQTLSGTNTYTGPTTVSQGKLVVNGSIIPSTGSSTLTVASGASLGGSGTIGSASNNVNIIVQSGGTLAPGNSPGIINHVGALTLNAGSTFLVDVWNPTSDQVNLTGSLTINNATLSTIWGGGTDNIFRGGVPNTQQMVWLVLNDGADGINGTFLNDGVFVNTGLQGLFGGTTSPYLVNSGGGTYALFYNANSAGTGLAALTGGNDLLLIAIPEPSRALLAILALLPLALRRRR
jgi:autotransporter-associated beta strand protein